MYLDIPGILPPAAPTFKFALRQDLVEHKEFLPTQGDALATGWDVRAALNGRTSISLRAGQHVRIPLGFRAFCPPGWWYELRPRSSSFAKKSLHALYGVVDETYEGELIFAAQYLPDVTKFAHDLTITFGEPIGQIIPVTRKSMIVEEVSNEEYEALCAERAGTRGAGGFGSTDVKRK